MLVFQVKTDLVGYSNSWVGHWIGGFYQFKVTSYRVGVNLLAR
jgi:hypothetical protein